MTYRPQALSLQGNSPKGQLRIAIPSWRLISGTSFAEPKPEQLLSREEIQSLFWGDLFQGTLKDCGQKRSALTLREKQEKSVAMRLRQALYPESYRIRSH